MLNCHELLYYSREIVEYLSSSQAPPRTMWTTLYTISFVLAVWSGVLVGATDNSHAALKRCSSTPVSMPTKPCTSSNNGRTLHSTTHTDYLWICSSGKWLPYKLLSSMGTTNNFAASSCKEIQSMLSNICHSPTSGTFCVNISDPCGNMTYTQIYCEMTLDDGGWTMVWKHSYMQVGSLTEDMKYFSNYYKPCADLEAGWCNVPDRIRFEPTEMMIVAYHNKGVVYAYKGIYNGGLDVNWNGGVLFSPVKIVDRCTVKNGVPPDPYIGGNLGGLAFDKYSPGGGCTSNCDTIQGSLTRPRDCRFENCNIYRHMQMTMAIYVR